MRPFDEGAIVGIVLLGTVPFGLIASVFFMTIDLSAHVVFLWPKWEAHLMKSLKWWIDRRPEITSK